MRGQQTELAQALVAAEARIPTQQKAAYDEAKALIEANIRRRGFADTITMLLVVASEYPTELFRLSDLQTAISRMSVAIASDHHTEWDDIDLNLATVREDAKWQVYQFLDILFTNRNTRVIQRLVNLRASNGRIVDALQTLIENHAELRDLRSWSAE